ncbi:MAG: formate/nitrite transporter family protein [Erysipelotrichaceae bacterium]|nr:formate/nitrite transporter family protein [Lachnospiraceae bacterium]MBR6958394.1 formate/nitrite transporter family protein [Erysipelotrichaceae bacterium]
MLKKILAGIAAGILISIGGSVFLACDIKYVGAIMFTVALLCICFKGYSLYTGKIGFIPEKHDKEAFSVLLLGLLGNAIATIVCGIAIRYAIPALGETALTICTAKLTQSFGSVLIRGIFCGILMYLAVSIYRDKNNVLGIVFGIPVFILAGFEHSIADMFYFAASGIVSVQAFGFLWTVVLGNTIGGMLLPVITGALRKEKTNG